ncbi:MAG: LacI family DNA-binding transcriptional regulator [Pararhizobium sp.]
MPSEKPARRRVTLLDVAREAGVSRATASLVLRKSPLVGDETRRRVEAAIEALGYVYNLGAARMRAAHSRTVGVIIPNLTNPFFAEMLAGIDSVLDDHGLVVLLANSRDMEARQVTMIRRLREHGVDGIIVCPATGTTRKLLTDAEEWGLPLVQALRHVSETTGDYAGTDYAGGMVQAVDHLVGLGHRRIAFVTGSLHHSAHTERLAGFRTGLRKHGLPEDGIVSIPLTHGHAMGLAKRLVTGKDAPTAAICFNDVVGFGLSSGLFDLGLEVGRDFSVIGFDNLAEAEIMRPGLTTVATHPQAIGEAAAHLLRDRLADPKRAARRIVNLTELIERQSCGPADQAERMGRR